ncbi:MAG: hypothetical protein Q8P28_11000 [Deltaproteobacteria bacterium]|nr:hypothetical protein [Deltaproteobacteria bacterium]
MRAVYVCIAAGAGNKVKAGFPLAADLILFPVIGVNTPGITAVPGPANPYTAEIGIEDFYYAISDILELFIKVPITY